MRLRTDWLSRVLTVPYVPVLGPVHPDQFSAEMFTDVFAEVLAATRAGTALSFDKDRRWSTRKTDAVLVDEIQHCSDHTIVPVLYRRGLGTIKTFYYGHKPDFDALGAATRRCCTTYGAASGQVFWFHTIDTADLSCTRLLLKDFEKSEPGMSTDGCVVMDLDDCPPEVTATFDVFARAMAEHGFAFLHQRRAAGRSDGPILVSHVGGMVIGAIGPLTVMLDRAGKRMLLPQYFGVLPDHRGTGHGRALWRAAQRWGAAQGADYQLLQARVGYASERLFLSEGLRSLGFTAMVTA